MLKTNNYITYISSLFGKITILSVFLGFYLSFLVEGFYNITNFRTIFLGIGILFFVLNMVVYPKLKIDNLFLVYILFSFPLAIISVGFWYSLSGINVYFTVVTFIVIVSSGFKFFLKGLEVLAYILLFLALYEFITKTYIFVVYRETEWGLLPLDPKFYGGLSKIFRAKGLFEGPLALSQFAIALAFIFRSNLRLLIVAVMLSILANGRLGMVITGVLFVLYFFNKYNVSSWLRNKKFLRIIVISILILCISIFYFFDEKSIERISNMLKFEDSGNTARLYYWEKAITTFFDYNFLNSLFGNSGYFRNLIGNSAENGWLMLLLDNGILGFLFYFIPLLVIISLGLKYQKRQVLYVSILFFAMIVQTFNLGVSASLLYWVIIYSLYLEVKNKNVYA